MTNEEALQNIIDQRRAFNYFAATIGQSATEQSTFHRYIRAIVDPSLLTIKSAITTAANVATSDDLEQFEDDVAIITNIFLQAEPYDVSTISNIFFSAYTAFAEEIEADENDDATWLRWKLALLHPDLTAVRDLQFASLSLIAPGDPSQVEADAAALLSIYEGLDQIQ